MPTGISMAQEGAGSDYKKKQMNQWLFNLRLF